jgi:ApaG protein
MPNPQFSCSVAVRELPEQTSVEAGLYAYAYTVTIVNTGDVTAQLIGRHWQITDDRGHTEQVRGLGVIGQQPLLKPGERFEYTSWMRIATPTGTMRGVYYCMTDEAAPFEAPIPEFRLGGAPPTLH